MFNKNIIPLVSINNLDIVEPLLKALKQASFNSIEIVLRSPLSMEAIKRASQCSDIQILAGTVVSIEQALIAQENGATAIVSPGFSSELVAHCQKNKIAIYPGVSSASEVMLAQNSGLSVCKFFPAEVSGGVPWLKAIHGPFPDMQFMPTGGINKQNVQEYLACPNVCAVGGSFILPATLNPDSDWDSIGNMLQQAHHSL